MRFTRVEVAGRAAEVVISEQDWHGDWRRLINGSPGPHYGPNRDSWPTTKSDEGKPFKLILKRVVDEAAPP